MHQIIKLLTLLVVLCTVANFSGCTNDPQTNGVSTDTDTLDDWLLQFDDDPSVPQSCEEVQFHTEQGDATTVGCEFYSSSLDASYYQYAFAIVLANVNLREDAHYKIFGSTDWDYDTQSGNWQELKSGTLSPLREKVIQKEVTYLVLNDNRALFGKPETLSPNAVMRKGAYKIVSDVPIVAYQFNPLSGAGSYASDASTLLPVSAWSSNYQVIGYHSISGQDAGYFRTDIDFHLAYAAIVAAKDGTEVTITPSTSLRPGYASWYTDEELIVPGGQDEFKVTLNEADVLYIHADVLGESLSGTTIQTDPDHPVAVFTGHQCALIPDWADACDNVEEQLPGLRNWGKSFVAARMPNRNRTNHTDPVLWQISAAEDNTTVTFQADEHVKGLPDTEIVLQKGEVADFYVYGSFVHPGDFVIEADKAIAVLQYMTGAGTTSDAAGNVVKIGDPAMVYVPPSGQFLTRYAVHVPHSWDNDYFIITRLAGSETYLDGQPVDDGIFKTVAGTGWEVGRLLVKDGNHIIESNNNTKRFGLLITGLDEYDSYAYSGGMGFARLYDPQ